MKNPFLNLIAALALVSANASPLALATDHAHEHEHDPAAKHFMVLLGESEVFASHVVYKVPHNYQVLLKLNLDSATESTYFGERKLHPKDTFYLLLDKVDMSRIAQQAELTGSLLRYDSS